MSLQIGIIGLPNVGKSTLFNALTENQVLAANYPFATIEPNTGVVPVPDEKLEKLAAIIEPEETIPATVNFLDIAGLVEGASEGEGLGNQFLAQIREVDAIAHVVRAFEDTNVAHPAGDIDPESDIATINTELALADVETVQKRLEKVQGQAKADPSKQAEAEQLEKILETLNQGQPLSEAKKAGQISAEELDKVRDLHLLTLKPIIYIFNIGETDLNNQEKQDQLSHIVKPAPSIFINAQLEAELAELPDQEARELLSEYGLAQSGLTRLIQAGYQLLDLQTFYTAGEKEVRAWTITQGATAPEAAGRIHSDFQKGFIAADTVNIDKLIDLGSWTAARRAGAVRTEGKDYVMQPGDVVEFKFNV